jgi:hypothetical protein
VDPAGLGADVLSSAHFPSLQLLGTPDLSSRESWHEGDSGGGFRVEFGIGGLSVSAESASPPHTGGSSGEVAWLQTCRH